MIGRRNRTREALGAWVLLGALGCGAGGDGSPGTTTGGASDAADDATSGQGGSTSSASTGSSSTGGASTSSDSTGGDATANSSGGDATTGSEGGAASSGAGGAPGDPPYADVVAVEVSGEAGGYTFAVSIESADIDCSQYADFWEVLSEQGELIFRHTLTHSHTDENGTTDADAPGNTFTRSGGPVPVGADEVVIVRAHLSNLDEYNGVVMRGNATAGFASAPEIGPEFAAEVLEAPPEPPPCLF